MIPTENDSQDVENNTVIQLGDKQVFEINL